MFLDRNAVGGELTGGAVGGPGAAQGAGVASARAGRAGTAATGRGGALAAAKPKAKTAATPTAAAASGAGGRGRGRGRGRGAGSGAAAKAGRGGGTAGARGAAAAAAAALSMQSAAMSGMDDDDDDDDDEGMGGKRGSGAGKRPRQGGRNMTEQQRLDRRYVFSCTRLLSTVPRVLSALSAPSKTCCPSVGCVRASRRVPRFDLTGRGSWEEAGSPKKLSAAACACVYPCPWCSRDTWYHLPVRRYCCTAKCAPCALLVAAMMCSR